LLMVVLLIASHPRQTPSSTPCGRNFTPVVGAPHGLLIPMGEMDASRPSGICCDGANVRRQKEPAGVGAGREFKSDEGSKQSEHRHSHLRWTSRGYAENVRIQLHSLRHGSVKSLFRRPPAMADWPCWRFAAQASGSREHAGRQAESRRLIFSM
jgi:hypothetical protein